MTTSKKTATKGSNKANKSIANAVSKVQNTAVSAKADKAPLTEEEAAAIAAKAARNLDRLVTNVTNEIMAEVKNSVLGLNNWLNTFKRIAAKKDPSIAKQFEDDKKYAHFVILTKMGLNHVVVLSERENKETGEKETIRRIVPTMWLRKTDKVSIPTDFTKGKVSSYRFNDKKGKGEEVAISDSKELAVTRSVKSPVMEVVTNSEGIAYTTQKQELNSEGVMVKVWEDKDVVFIPVPQLDFDFKEVKDAIKAAMLATFGSNA